MELRDLKAFVTLGEVLHFGQAAAEHFNMPGRARST